jgi:hypothetical protein
MQHPFYVRPLPARVEDHTLDEAAIELAKDAQRELTENEYCPIAFLFGTHPEDEQQHVQIGIALDVLLQPENHQALEAMVEKLKAEFKVYAAIRCLMANAAQKSDDPAEVRDIHRRLERANKLGIKDAAKIGVETLVMTILETRVVTKVMSFRVSQDESDQVVFDDWTDLKVATNIPRWLGPLWN